MIRVACINKATVDLGVSFEKLNGALQLWYDRDVRPSWDAPGQSVPALQLYIPPKGHEPSATDWQIVYLDDADEAGALGYHDLIHNSQPISYVFVKPTLKAGELVSVTAAHEFAEMAKDPYANDWSQRGDGDFYAKELCDACEEDTYPVNGVPMSNFVLPSWFLAAKWPAGTKFDFLGKLKAPFTMTKDGYVITSKAGKVKEVFGSEEKAARFAREDRRGHRSEYRKPDGLMIPGSEAERRWFDRASSPEAGGAG